jgi:hypothetical protein
VTPPLVAVPLGIAAAGFRLTEHGGALAAFTC